MLAGSSYFVFLPWRTGGPSDSPLAKLHVCLFITRSPWFQVFPPPWGKRRAPGGGTKARLGGGGGPKCRGKEGVGVRPVGAASPFCSRSRLVNARYPRPEDWRLRGSRRLPLHRPRRSEISTRRPASPGEAGWGLALAGRAPACVGAGGELSLSSCLRGEQPGPVTGGGGMACGWAAGAGPARPGCRKPAPLPSAPGFTAGSSGSPTKEEATVNQSRSARPPPSGTRRGEAAWCRGRAP